MEKYKSLIHGQQKYHDYLVVNWCFHNICNFSCSYCPDTLHNGKARGMPLEIVTRFCENIIKTTIKKKVFFEFTGGEMTYYRNFSELFEFLKSKGADTGLISNGSRDLKWWAGHRHLIDHICLSFHGEEGDADHFYDVVKYMNETVTTHVNIMMLPEKFDELYKFSQKIASTIDGVSISMQPLMEGMAGDLFNYTEEQKKILDTQELPWKENVQYRANEGKEIKVYRGEMRKEYSDGSTEVVSTPELISKKENDWFGWDCNIGIENIVVDLAGNVLRGWCGVGGIIGNIRDENFKVPSKPVRCTSHLCACGLDIMATKVCQV
jgi:MoaA/NifB/PqqE/SkfB family radical SAM enzyme